MGKVATYKGFGLTEAQAISDAYSTAQSDNMLNRLLLSVLGDSFATEESTKARPFINELLMRCYPNEAAIKASFINSVILKQAKSAVSIFELPVGESRADLCKVNGHSAAYEIKTDLDTFYRLEKQLTDYFDVFDYVYVVTSDNRVSALPDYVPDSCGIYSYHQKRDGRYVFTLRQHAKLNRSQDSEKQLGIMPKRDLASESGLSANQSKQQLIDQCLAQFDHHAINLMFKSFLKRRYRPRWEYFKSVRPEICEIDYEWFFHNNIDPAYIY